MLQTGHRQGSRCRPRPHPRHAGGAVESLELRRLMAAVPAGNVSGMYTTDTEWTDTSAPYVLSGNVVVNATATLTIGAGVRVIRPQFSGAGLVVANDNSSARLNATGARFDVPVTLRASAGGTVADNTFNFVPTFEGDANSPLSVTGNAFNAGAESQAEFVPRLAANAFGAGTAVGVSGAADADVTWPVIPDVDHYSLSGNVTVNGGALLTIAAGVRVVRPQFSGAGLVVANDGSAARLNAAGVQFDVPLTARAAAAGTLSGNVFNGPAAFEGDSTSALVVTGNSFNGGVEAEAEFVPRLPANAFATGSTLSVEGAVDATTAWPVIPNVSEYSLGGNVTVNGGAALTVAAGLRLTRPQFSGAGLVVANDGSSARLVAAGARFDVPVTARAAATGTLSGNVFGAGAAATFEGDGTSALSVVGNTFNGGADVQAEFVPRLAANAFAPGSVVGVSGTVDAPTAWAPLANVDRYSLSGNVSVLGGQTLTVGYGVRVGRPTNSGAALVVAADSSAASLRATGARFDAPVSFRNNAGGRLRYCDLNATLTVSGSATALVQENDLSGGSVVAEGASAQVIDLRNNYWGAAATAAAIEAKVLHRPDAPANTRPLVLYEPFLPYDPTDLTPPVLGATFSPPPPPGGGPQVLRLVASEDVSASLAPADLLLRNLTTDAVVPVGPAQFGYAAETNVATVTFDPPLPGGRYRLTVAAASVTDPAGNPLAADLVYDFVVNPNPVVTEVFVSGSAWAAPFMTFLQSHGLGSGTFGFLVEPGAQPNEVAWVNIDRVSVRFSEPVHVAAGNLSVRGGVAVPSYAVDDFGYDPATYTATWTLTAPLKLDRVRFALSGVTDLAGNALADFLLPVNVVPGDVDRNGRVDALDLLDVRNRLGAVAAAAGGSVKYSPWNDVDGNGQVDVLDLARVRAAQGATLARVPAAPAALFSVRAIAATSAASRLAGALEREGEPLLG